MGRDLSSGLGTYRSSVSFMGSVQCMIHYNIYIWYCLQCTHLGIAFCGSVVVGFHAELTSQNMDTSLRTSSGWRSLTLVRTLANDCCNPLKQSIVRCNAHFVHYLSVIFNNIAGPESAE